LERIRELQAKNVRMNFPARARAVSVHFLHACFFALRTRSVLTDKFSGGERDVASSRALRRGFWRAHHKAWVQSELNQREFCEAYGVPLKAFGNWRAKFKAEPQTPARKVLVVSAFAQTASADAIPVFRKADVMRRLMDIQRLAPPPLG
jgi:hypothetical protein